jgi:hypothetical protein
MAPLMIKDKVIQEIDLIPEEQLADLYNFIHYFRLGLETSSSQDKRQALAFAGSWRDMPADAFSDFMSEIAERRRQAFTRRRNGESVAD